MSLPCELVPRELERSRAPGIDIEVAGLRCRVESSSPELVQLVGSRRSWLPPSPGGEPALTIRYAVRDHRQPLAPIEGAGPFEVDRSGATTRVADDTFSAEIDLEGGLVSAAGLLSLAGIDTIVRIALPELVDDALLLHSCILGRGGRAWVCSGPSGAGKSTLIELLPDLAVGDELSLVTRREGALQARPLWATTDVRGPLDVESIFLLEHGDAHESRPVGPSEGLRRLARETGWPVLSRGAAERTFALLAWIVDNVPIRNLRFTPDAGVLEVLNG